MTAYYNEIHPAAVAVLRELIDREVIAPGLVDDRSIKDVTPNDLRGFTQAHFFAGGGFWSVAARLAGWPDSRSIWTGSCPCQPFSAAGKRHGTDDPRHLWPDFHRLISACRPPVVMGEQVAGAAGYDWFDGVGADLANENYASRCIDIPACAVDAPHQRNRLYWVAMDNRGRARWSLGSITEVERGNLRFEGAPAAALDVGADGCRSLLQSDTDRGGCSGQQEDKERQAEQRAAAERPDAGLQPNADKSEFQGQPSTGQQPLAQSDARALRNGSWWSDSEWIVSPLDGKARRAKPGLPFLVDGLPGRVDLWRVGGNAILPVLAAEVIAAFLETEAIACLGEGALP